MHLTSEQNLQIILSSLCVTQTNTSHSIHIAGFIYIVSINLTLLIVLFACPGTRYLWLICQRPYLIGPLLPSLHFLYFFITDRTFSFLNIYKIYVCIIFSFVYGIYVGSTVSPYFSFPFLQALQF